MVATRSQTGATSRKGENSNRLLSTDSNGSSSNYGTTGSVTKGFGNKSSETSDARPWTPPNGERLLSEYDAPLTDPDHGLDRTGVKEFGGNIGTLFAMVFFPFIMWYLWIGMKYYHGQLPLPEAGQSLKEFGLQLYNYVYEGAYPTAKAWAMYWSFFLFQMVLYCYLPGGVWSKGMPLEHRGGARLDYYCNAISAFYLTNVIFAVLHVTGIFPLYTIIDEFGSLLSVSIFSGIGVAFVAYFSAKYRGVAHRMTGSFIYDFWMGAELNPRIGVCDFKMFFEVRLPWYILHFITVAAACKQYETYGYVTPNICFLMLAHWLYANACSKGEELIVTTWDMSHEKWGYMLIFWNMAGVPMTYCHCTLYLVNNNPEDYRFSTFTYCAMFFMLIFCYWVWDSCNSQKNRFRQMEKGTLQFRKTFPQVPWQTIHNPTYIRCKNGGTLLTSGWYGLARKIHYTVDWAGMMMWGLICGFNSPIPYFLPLFFTVMILHRATRDIAKCKARYGADWDEYTRQVPYLFIPYVI